MPHTPDPGGPRGVSRRNFVRGLTTAGAGGFVVGGAAAWVMKPQGGTGFAGAASGETIKIGSVAPVTGPYSGDGLEMVRGAKMAIEDINAAGGVAGRPVELITADISDQAPENFIQAAQRLVSQEQVAAAFAGYTSTTSAEYDIYGNAGVPLLHTNTLQANTDYVVEHGITNIFQCCPTEIWYAKGFLQLMQEWIDARTWVPKTKTAAVISSNDSYSISIAKVLQDGIKAMGWEVTHYDEVTAPNADWGPQLARIRANPPALIFITDYLAGDLASFATQFASAPTPSLLYQQYGPSVPEYLDLAKGAANGILWSTTIGTLPDQMGTEFADRYRKKYNVEPGMSQSGAQYDTVRLWARAAAQAGDPYDFDTVTSYLKSTIFRGVVGTYRFDDKELTAVPYPDKVDDPSLAMPHLTYQIQDGKQVLLSPAPYGKGTFVLPAWIH
ncbi:branched-chain amino acid transport system substrate-binding protein [Mycobacterium frederiksbergense]|uniref:Branched-chain amino acid transport system substrate-binding protein n=1 Tax=Mycolicibacterium frederiksbergense TaxID=117567 RepID=A0ABT6L371_9MYCO|nr:ABC transporter substrate-binding protein [Mycolicibacterium frederiksbergense]MDH6197384.1 branched-chain amino acid transport system substrate-binding protein [Mycolicibacterium frederiksbergense]